MIPRYSRAKMSSIWEIKNKFSIWMEIECHIADIMSKIGEIPKEAAKKIKNSKKPIIISGGGVFYSDAMDELSNFAIKHNIPVTQTVMGYSTMKRDHSHYAGQIGGLGGKNTNSLASE